ncbi:MAG: EamA family transporter [Acidobacteriota bacterium]|nr:EamA family transporter [Blastocatellia bacterium]MDW8411137.1 EamA family transporter [Acidobacteriota bacterium]
MKSLAVIALIVVSGALGDIFLARGMKQVGSIDTLALKELLQIARRVLFSGFILLGIGCMAVAFFSLVTVLAWEKVSVVEPATSLSYVINTLGAKFYLKEEVDLARWIGTVLVTLGIACLCL